MSSQKNGDARRAARGGGLPAGAAPLLAAAGVPGGPGSARHRAVPGTAAATGAAAGATPRTGGGATALRVSTPDGAGAPRAGRGEPQARLPALSLGGTGGAPARAQAGGPD